MRPIIADLARRPKGRPPIAELDHDDLVEIAAIYLKTNRTRKDGSVITAWVDFCQNHPDRFGHLVRHNVPATCVPTAAREACLRARSLVGLHRGGAARLRSESAFVPGTMRIHTTEPRRLYAGEQFSVDDATRNVACWIPWPWGGCPCSEKFGVRLGRWQTLVVHDDATGFIPAVSTVFRYQQSYRGVDAASLILRTERDICQPSAWVLEGGVWQGSRVIPIVGNRFIDAKGRPNQKLVEGYFNRLWQRMSMQPGDVGRHRGEIRKVSDIYVKCRAGKLDPRDHFMSFEIAQAALYQAISWLSDKLIDSRTYGKWVPIERWHADIAAHPRHLRPRADLWLASPVAVPRKVRRQSVVIREDGPLGVPMDWTFAAPWLAGFDGREVMVYFDPLDAWPVTAHITAKDNRMLLGTAECISPVGSSRNHAVEITKAIRASMLHEYRALTTNVTERHLRTPEATATYLPSGEPQPTTAATSDRPTIPLRPLRDPAADPSPPAREPAAAELTTDIRSRFRDRAQAARLARPIHLP